VLVVGEASGAAAVLSMHEEVTPRELDSRLLVKQLQAQGAVVQAQDMPHPDPAEFEQTANSAVRGQQSRKVQNHAGRQNLFMGVT
jgi:hypothetical protein